MDARTLLETRHFGDLRRHRELDSTNLEALRLAASGAAEGVAVVTDHQSDGRGRRGRRWVAPPGSALLVSVVLRPRLPPDRLHLTAIAAALAASDACADVIGVRPELKWPNDLVVGRGGEWRKLGGVLAETASGASAGSTGTSAAPAVVVGLGLNLNWPDPPEAELTALLGHAVAANQLLGAAVDGDSVLAHYLTRLDRWYWVLGGSGGCEELLAAYRARCCTLGRSVRAIKAGATVTGRAVGIGPVGQLLVEADGECHEVSAGEVVHLR